MFFLHNNSRVIHEAPDLANCPACGQACWESIQWQLGIRYSLWFTMVFIGDAISLPILAYLAAEYILGNTVKTFLLTPLGVLCSIVVAVVSTVIAYWLVHSTITTKYWANRPGQSVRVCKCTQCRSAYLFIFKNKY